MPDGVTTQVKKELNDVSMLAVQAKADPALMADLWGAVQKLVKLWAYRYVRKSGLDRGNSNFEADDLIQSGYLALVKAVAGYDPDKGFAFTSYFYFHIRRYFANTAGVKESDLLKELDMKIVSLDIPVNDEGDTSLVDLLGDPNAEFADAMIEDDALRQDCAALLEEIDKLPDKQRQALALTARDGLTFTDAAKALGCSDMTVKYHADNGAAAVRETPVGRRIRDDRCYYKHVGLARFKTTFTSAVEWAVLWKEERGLLCNDN